MAKKEKTYTTSVSEMVEGKKLTREAFKNIDLKVMDEWVKTNHPEIRAEWVAICQQEQEIIKLFPDKKKAVEVLDDDGNVVMKTIKKRDGTTKEVPKTEDVPYGKGEKRELTVFEIRDWLCGKYGMMPDKLAPVEKKRKAVGNW